MRQEEADLIQQIKAVGVSRAREIFSFLSLWEEGASEEEAPLSGISKKQEDNLTALGEAVIAFFPKKERKIKANGIGRRVQKLVVDLLLERGALHRSEVLEYLKGCSELSDLKWYQIQGACDATPGLTKYLGRWSLQASKKAA